MKPNYKFKVGDTVRFREFGQDSAIGVITKLDKAGRDPFYIIRTLPDNRLIGGFEEELEISPIELPKTVAQDYVDPEVCDGR